MVGCSNLNGASYSLLCMGSLDISGSSPEAFVYRKRHLLLNIMDVFFLKGRFIKHSRCVFWRLGGYSSSSLSNRGSPHLLSTSDVAH